ncbi:MAG: Crp/Fnr family transcriptional regulator [Acidobacteriota bacterium]
MKHLALLGDGSRLLELAGRLRADGFAVTLLPVGRSMDRPHAAVEVIRPPDLALVETSRREDLDALARAAERGALPWIYLCTSDDDAETDAAELTTTAYRAGALAVLPADSSPELVVQAIERSIASLHAASGHTDPGRPRHWALHAGDAIPLRADETLRVVSGVVAQIVWHEDGSEGLIGLWGPGHLLAGHPEDECGLALRAHTDAEVEIDRLGRGGDEGERLLERVRHLEAWSSVQSRQNMQQRLLGVLTLLAEQFGSECADGTLIDVRITHAQLAAAIGANRATVTRLLGPLRRRGEVLTVHAQVGERFCLPHSGDADHWLHLPRQATAGRR